MSLKRLKLFLIAIAVLLFAFFGTVYAILSRYDFNSLKPKISHAVLEATGRKLVMNGDIRLDVGLRPALVVDNISFQNAPWGSRPNLAAIKRLEVQVALIPLVGGNIEFKRLILIEPDIFIETDASGKSNLDFKNKEGAAKPEKGRPAVARGSLPALTFNQVRIEKGRLAYKNGRSGKTYLFILDSLRSSSAGRSKPVQIKLRGSYNEAPLEVEGKVGPIRQLAHPGKPWPVNLNAKAGGTVVTLDGSIKDIMNAKGLELNVTADVKSLGEIARIADLEDVPDPGPFKIEVKISDPKDKTYKFSSLKVSLGPNDLAGSMEVALAGERPFLTAALTSKKLDLRSLTVAHTETGGAAATSRKPKAKKKRVFSDRPLPLSVLRKFDAKATIEAGQILLQRAALDGLAAEITLKDGVLDAEPIEAAIGGGVFKGGLNLRANRDIADMDIRLEVTRLDLARMLRELNAKDILQGSLDASINVRGRGKSVAGLMGSLEGKTIVHVGEGSINNEYLNLLGGNLNDEVLRLLNPVAKRESRTDLDCFVSRFDIKGGIAENTVLVLNTNNMSVVGDGRINLETEQLDLSLKPSPKKGAGTTGSGQMNLSFGELVKPFKLSGTLANPRLAIDPTQSAVTIGKAAGGVALLGPLGVAAALAGGGEGVSCSAAVSAAQKGVKIKSEGESSTIGKAAKDAEESVKGAGRRLKEFFGR